MPMFNVAVKLFWEGAVEAKDEKEAQSIAEERAAEYAEVESSDVTEIDGSEAVHIEKPDVDSSIFCAKCLDEFLGVGKCSEHEPRFRNRLEHGGGEI